MIYPFVIFALPRSRTAWLSSWLSCNGLQVAHDLAPHATTVQGYLDSLWPYVGTVETGAQDAHHLLRTAMPTSKFIIIRRPVSEVIDSLAKFGITDQTEELERRDAVLDDIETWGAFSVPYHELSDARVCCDLFEYLYGMPFDFKWWYHMDRQNIQIDVPAQLQLLNDRRTEIAALKSEVQELLADDPQFLRIGWENFESMWIDAEPLAIAHHLEVNAGVPHGQPFDLDVPLLIEAERIGALRMITARVNGRLVGYATWSFMTDPESKGVRVADQGGWYVDPASPGIGKKMLKQSIDMLKGLGIQSVQLHHQLHGRGAKLGTLFTRMGAVEHQHRYTLWIGD